MINVHIWTLIYTINTKLLLMKHLPVAKHALHLSFLVGGALCMLKSQLQFIKKMDSSMTAVSVLVAVICTSQVRFFKGMSWKIILKINPCFSSCWELGIIGMLLISTPCHCVLWSRQISRVKPRQIGQIGPLPEKPLKLIRCCRKWLMALIHQVALWVGSAPFSTS